MPRLVIQVLDMEKGDAIQSLAFLNLCVEIHKSIEKFEKCAFQQICFESLTFEIGPKRSEIIAKLSVYKEIGTAAGNGTRIPFFMFTVLAWIYH